MQKRFGKEYFLRIGILLVGLLIAHLGVTLFMLTNLGADPFNVLIQGMHRVVTATGVSFITHGMVHMAVCFLILAVLFFVDKSYIRIGAVICMFFGGPIIDMYMLIFRKAGIESVALPVKIVILAIGCVILAFGMTIVIRSEAGTGPNDLVGLVISDKTGKRFGIVRVIVDIGFVVLGVILGGTFGIGTIICAFLVGPVADICMPVSQKIVTKILEAVR